MKKQATHATDTSLELSSISQYSWLGVAFNQITSSFDQNKLAHGILVVAPEQSGKRLFANDLAKSILCDDSKGRLAKACNVCKSCLLIEADSHPDLTSVDCLIDNKGKQKKSIGIDQIRSLTNKLIETPQLSGWRVAIIASVEKMTRGAFNAILKTLEEPGDRTLLLMLANSTHQIPATIKSRCQELSFKLNDDVLLPWLTDIASVNEMKAKDALNQNLYSPFAAKEFLESNGALEMSNLESDLDNILLTNLSPQDFLSKNATFGDKLWLKIANYFNKTLLSILESNKDVYSNLPRTFVSQLYDELLKHNRAQCAGSNLQANIQLESILIQWFEMGRKIRQT